MIRGGYGYEVRGGHKEGLWKKEGGKRLGGVMEMRWMR